MAGLNNAKQNSSYVRKLYTGVTPLRPVLINPTVADLKSIGIEAESTRQYTNLELGEKMWTKIVIFLEGIGLEGDKILTNVEFLVSNRVRKSQTGKTQFASKAGVFSWAEEPSMLQEWFKNKGASRPAFEGEEDLLNFFIGLGNLDTYSDDAEVGFADWSKIASGDVSELREYITSSSSFMTKDTFGNPTTVTREVKCLCYVQKDKYMRVFSKAFDSVESIKPTRIIKALDGLLKPLESLESKDITFRSFTPSLDLAKESSLDGVETPETPSDLPF
jgi:hypothetical protein